MTNLLVFGTSVVTSAALSGVVRRVAIVLNAVVPARADRWHSRPTPTFGGIAIAGTTTVVAAAAAFFRIPTPGLPLALLVGGAGLLLFGVGFVDDRLQLLPLTKLAAALSVGAFLVFGLTVVLQVVLPWWRVVLLVIWFAGVVHAFNLLDNMDGLASGVAVIAIAFLGWTYGSVVGALVTALLIGLGGSLVGFLVWNVRPARLFMGDCGSLFLGGIIGGTALVPLVRPVSSFWLDGTIACLILAVPLFDTSFVLLLRRLAGRGASKGGTDHLSHRLVSLGLSERSAVAVLCIVGLLGGFFGALVSTRGLAVVPLAVLFGVGMLMVGIYLARVKAYNGDDFIALQKSSFAPLLRDLTFRWHAAEMLLDVVLITVIFYLSYRIRFEDQRFDIFLPSFTMALPAILGCKLLALHVCGVYSRMWGTFGLQDVFAVVRGVVAGSILSVLVAAYFYRFELFSRGVFIIDAALLVLVLVAVRGSFRMMGEAASDRSTRGKRVLIYGAGSGGQILVREMRVNPAWARLPAVFVDDDPRKFKCRILGVPVKGDGTRLEELIRRHRIAEVIISTHTLAPEREAAVQDVCARLKIPIKHLHLELG